MGERDDLVFENAAKEVANTWAHSAWAWNKNDIVGFGSREAIVVEVVDHYRVAVGGEMDVKLQEERYKG